ncbi:MAG: DinB family protein, partial [Gemmatimonadales bacterium]
MPSRTRDPRIVLLLQTIDSAYLKRGWHGPVLRAVLKDLPAAVARHRPVRGRHSIWELALHTAYWKYIVRRRLTGDDSLTFPRTGANFPAVPARGGEKEWRADLQLLDEEHRLLR